MADSNPNSIMNLDPQAFVAALDEWGIQGDERNRLVGMYRDQTASGRFASALHGDVGEGMVRRTILPIATKQGMTGAEALMSGDFEFAVPEMLSFLYQAPADAFATYDASVSGLPVSQEEFDQKMMNLGSVMAGSNVMAGQVAKTAGGIKSLPLAAADTAPQNDFYKLLTGQKVDVPPQPLPTPPPMITVPGGELRRPEQPYSPIGPRAGTGPARPSDPKAEALGFLDTVYHTTLSPEEFTKFDLNRSPPSNDNKYFQDQLGVHVGTAKAAEERNIGANQEAGNYNAYNSSGDLLGHTMELRARTDKPFTKEAFAEFLGVKPGELFRSLDGPMTEKELLMVYEEYANVLLGQNPGLANHYGTVEPQIAAKYLRKELADQGFTHIPYKNAVEDKGSTSFIMLVDRADDSPAVLRDVRAEFDPNKLSDPDLRFSDGGEVDDVGYAEGGPIDNLKVVGNSVYRVAPDGQMFFVRSLAEDPTANTDVFAAAPPRADDPSFYASTPDQGYFGEQAIGMAAPYLKGAYDLASTATTMTPDKDSYVPESVQRMGKFATNMGIAGLQTLVSPFYGAAGLVGDVAKAVGVPRSEALTGDLGAMLDYAGVLPEGRILSAMADAGAVGQVAGNARRAVNTAVEKAPVVYADAIGNARALAQGDLEFMRGRGLPSESAAAGAQITGQGTGAGAIIRPDDVFRGNGPITTSLSVASKPYAVRVTGQSQIEDMIQSGLIRPKEGGYGQEGKAILYFGEMDDAVPNSIFTRPKGDGDKNYTIVADSSKIAGREGPIPLDDVQHIWTMRDGQMVDILDEVKLKNREFGAAPGMGDNGGPPLLDPTLDIFEAPPQRYVDPTLGRYSKAFEAANTLKQEVGTPQQMRAALINQGVPKEELLYTGFDNWLQGRDKVTKQEIVDILGDIAINKSGQGSLPFGRITHEATGPIGGKVAQWDANNFSQQADLRTQVEQDRLIQADRLVEDYADTLKNTLREQGFKDLSDIDPNTISMELFQDLENAVAEADRKGLYVDDTFRWNVGYVRDLVSKGVDFNSGAIRNEIWYMLSEPNYIAPDGSIVSGSTAMERYLPGQETPSQMDSRLRAEIQEEVYQMPPEEVYNYLGIDPSEYAGEFDPGTTHYYENSPKGLLDYRENRYGYNDLGRGVISGYERDLGTKPYGEGHFYSGSQDENRMYHTRAGFLNTTSGNQKIYHLFEAQSDIGQRFRDDPSRFHVTGTKPVFDVPKDEKKKLQEYITMGKKYQDLMDQENAAMDVLYSDKYLDIDTGRLKKDVEGYEELSSHIRDLRAKSRPLSTQLMDLATNNQVLDDMQRFYGRPDMSMLYGDKLDIKALEDALAGTLTPKPGAPGSPKGKTSTRPFTTSTNRWVPSALKDELFNAANSDAEWFSLPMGKDVETWTHGESAGQADFYENIVPTQLRKLLKKEFDLDVPVQKIKAEGFLNRDNPTYEVNAIRLTPELKRMIKEQGFSTFKKGGPVEGSSLADIDVFALP